MADDANATDTQKRSAAVLRVINGLAQSLQSAARKKKSDLRCERALDRLFQQPENLHGKAFADFQGDIADEAVADNYVHVSGEKISTFDVADKMDRALFQTRVNLAREFVALHFFLTDRQEADARPAVAKGRAVIDFAHHSKLHQVLRLGIHMCGDVEKHRNAAFGIRERGSKRDTIHRFQCAKQKSCNRHYGAGVTSADQPIGLGLTHQAGSDMNRAVFLSPKGLRRVILHGDYFACRHDVDRQVRRGVFGQLRAHDMGLPNEHHAYAQFTSSQNTAFNLGAGRVVSAHGVNSDCDHRIYLTALSGRQFLDGTRQKKAASGRLVLHGTAFIEAAVGTSLVRLLGFVAIRAFAERRALEKIMGSPGARPSLRMPSFGVRHSNTPRSRRSGRILWAFGPGNYCFFSQSCFRRASGASRGSVAWVSQLHSSWFRLAPQFGHNPRQSLWQITFRGRANNTCSRSTSARKRPSPSKKTISVSSSLSRSSFGLAPLGKGA